MEVIMRKKYYISDLKSRIRVGITCGVEIQFSSVAQSCPILCDPMNPM